MKNRAAEDLMAIAFLVIFAIFAVMSTDYGPRARLVPLPVAIASALLALGQLIVQNTRAANRELGVDTMALFGAQKTREERERKAEASKEMLTEIKVEGGKEWVALTIPLAFLAMIFVLGLHLSILLFVTGYFRYVNRARWSTSVLYGAGSWAVIFIFFVAILRLRLYDGLLFTWLFGTN